MSFLDRQVDPTTGTLTAMATFPNPDGLLRPGFYAKVRELREVRKGVVLVPQRAVTELQGTYQVIVIGADNKAETRPVVAGERVGSRWIIDAGLKPGERGVVEGLQKVRSGVATALAQQITEGGTGLAWPRPFVSASQAQPRDIQRFTRRIFFCCRPRGCRGITQRVVVCRKEIRSAMTVGLRPRKR